MGKSKSSKSKSGKTKQKKSAPKSKKARRKAQLENQWGLPLQQDVEVRQSQKAPRGGRRRRTSKAAAKKKEEDGSSTSSSDVDVDWRVGKRKRRGGDEDGLSLSSSENESESESEGGYKEKGFELKRFVSRIRREGAAGAGGALQVDAVVSNTKDVLEHEKHQQQHQKIEEEDASSSDEEDKEEQEEKAGDKHKNTQSKTNQKELPFWALDPFMNHFGSSATPEHAEPTSTKKTKNKRPQEEHMVSFPWLHPSLEVRLTPPADWNNQSNDNDNHNNNDNTAKNMKKKTCLLEALQQTLSTNNNHTPTNEKDTWSQPLHSLQQACQTRWHTSVRQVLRRHWSVLQPSSPHHHHIHAECHRQVLLQTQTPSKTHSSSSSSSYSYPLTNLQTMLYPPLSSYTDLLYTTETPQTRFALHNLLALHVLNHTLTVQTRIKKHNAKLQQRRKEEHLKKIAEVYAREEARVEKKKKKKKHNGDANLHHNHNNNNKKKKEEGEEMAEYEPTKEEEEVFRDQGFARPTVLVLLPTRDTCLQFVEKLACLASGTTTNTPPLAASSMHDKTTKKKKRRKQQGKEHMYGNVLHWDRFHAEFTVPPSTTTTFLEEHEDEEDPKEAFRRKRKQAMLDAKGPEWNEYFGPNVNDNDDFKVGLQVSPGNRRLRREKKWLQQQKQRSKQQSKPQEEKVGEDDKEEDDKKQEEQQEEEDEVEPSMSIKLYTDFARSDIILASPLALRMLLTNDDNDEDNNNNHQTHHQGKDLLTSIDICLLLHSDILEMQNWDHVFYCLQSLNSPRPSSRTAHVDFSRVRHYMLAGQAAQRRQLIVLSKVASPQVVSLARQFGQGGGGAGGGEGRMRVRRIYRAKDGVLKQGVKKGVLPKHGMEHVFRFVACQSMASRGEDMVEFFKSQVLPPLVKYQQAKTLVFIPSYFDFVSLRNMLRKQEVDTTAVGGAAGAGGGSIGGGGGEVRPSFVSVHEYADFKEVASAKARFFHESKKILLYTGRAHFFQRYEMKGVHHVIFFGLPLHGSAFGDVVNMMEKMKRWGRGEDHDDEDDEESEEAEEDVAPRSCLALFTKYDAHALEQIVGTDACRRMVSGQKKTYFFPAT